MNDSLLQNQEFLRTLLESVPSMLFVVDSDVRILQLNSAASRFLGVDANAAIMQRGGEALHCIHAGKELDRCGEGEACADCVIRNSVRTALQGSRVRRETTKMSLAAGSGVAIAHFQITTSPLAYDGNPYVLLVIEDITELKEAENALKSSEAKLRNITSVIGDGIYVLDGQGRLTFMNPEAEKLLGWSEAELLGKRIHDVIHFQKEDGTPLPASECPVIGTIKSGSTYRDDENVFTRKDGTLFPVAIVATALHDDGRVAGSVAVFHDITERKRAADELKRLNELLASQATTDPLTGASNRLKFNESLAVESKRFKRYGTPFSLIMFDIDQFKAINDVHGHHAGDDVLREVADIIRKNLRSIDLFARWGGEEFMIMVVNSDIEHAAILAEKLRLLIEQHEFPAVGGLTCSFGAAQLVAGESIDHFTKRLDSALYRAKAQGRNRVERAEELRNNSLV